MSDSTMISQPPRIGLDGDNPDGIRPSDLDGNRESQLSSIDVELWGPPGSGKTVLLASLYETFSSTRQLGDYTMSPELRDVHAKLITGEKIFATQVKSTREQMGKSGEQMSVTLTADGGITRRVRVTSHAGDDLARQDGEINVPRWVEERRGKVVVVCLNPFLIDFEIAWKGLQHTIAVLQSPGVGLALPAAVEAAAWTLFGYGPSLLRARGTLNRLLPLFRDTRLIYNPSACDPEKRFEWTECDTQHRDRLVIELRRLIDERIRLLGPLVTIVRRALKLLDQSMVVLTHVDIVDALLPSITFADFERVFSDLFEGRPERMVSQQVLSRLFRIEIEAALPLDGMSSDSAMDYMSTPYPDPMPSNGVHGSPGASPPPYASPANSPPPAPAESSERTKADFNAEAAKEVIIGRLREDGALQLVEYIKSLARFGVDVDSRTTISRLTRELEVSRANLEQVSAVRDQTSAQLDNANNNVTSLDARLKSTNGDVAKLTLELTRLRADLDIRRGTQSEIEQRLGKTKTDLDQTQAELDRNKKLAAELQGKLELLNPEAARAAHLTQELSEEQQSRRGVEEERSNLLAELRQARDRLEKLEEQLRAMVGGGGQMEDQIRKISAERDRLQQESTSQSAELARLAEELRRSGTEELRENLRQLESDRSSLYQKLSDANLKLEQVIQQKSELDASAKQWAEAVERQKKIGNDKLVQLTKQAQEAIAQRDAALSNQRQQLQLKNLEADRTRSELDVARRGFLQPEEAQARYRWETSRLSPVKYWALLTMRCLPIIPILAALICLIHGHIWQEFPYFSVFGFVGCSMGILLATVARAADPGARWIWFRSMDTRSNKLDLLTSVGERLNEPMEDYTLETSPLMSLLGLGSVRRNSTGQWFATHEPGSWLNAPERPRLQRRWLLDVMTIIVVIAWIAGAIYLYVANP